LLLKIFPWPKKEFFTKEERQRIVDAVRNAERRTSGEVRVFVEGRCPYMDAMDRAVQVFYKLGMQKTADRNAVIIYVALKDHQLAVYGDEGIHAKVGQEYWGTEVAQMISSFNRENYAEGIRQCVDDIGEALHTYFPFDHDTDKNELPDEIVFGK
jgi:uncharacterized membrane protein